MPERRPANLVTSSNARYKSGYGAIKAQFNSIGPNGLGFRVLSASGNNLGTTKHWTEQETDITRTLATGISDGTRFYNSFRETGTQCNVGNHEFDGSEWY